MAQGEIMVSVVMPMKNAEEYVEAAIESVLDGWMEVEVVVVMDGEEGDLSRKQVETLRDKRVRLVEGPRRGIGAAVNAGGTAARGEFISRCDADDLYVWGRLEKQARWLREHPEFGAICGGFAMMDESGEMIVDMGCGQKAEEITEELREGITRTHLGTYLVRRDVLEKVGGCREWFVTGEDIDLQLRLAEACRVWYEPERCYVYRVHDESITHRQRNVVRHFYEEAAREFRRQRQREGRDILERGEWPPVPGDGDGKTMRAAEQMQGVMIGLAWKKHQAGKKKEAVMMGMRACLKRPGNWRAWKSLGAMMVKKGER